MCIFINLLPGGDKSGGVPMPRACLELADGVTTDKRYPGVKFDACYKHKRDTWIPFPSRIKNERTDLTPNESRIQSGRLPNVDL